jgi:hypothetical protein
VAGGGHVSGRVVALREAGLNYVRLTYDPVADGEFIIGPAPGAASVFTGVGWALGREVPAGKYSPAMELHPMYRAAVTAKDASFAALWNATPAR